MNKDSHLFYLLRHGSVDGPSALYGRTDIPLSQRGWQQLYQQCRQLDTISQVVTSPLQRCKAFAEEFSRQAESPLTVIDDFRECDFGSQDGVPFDNIPKDDWSELHEFWRSPASFQFSGGEKLVAMQQRVSEAWNELVQQVQSSSTPQSVLCVVHGGVIRLILAHILELDWRNPALFSRLSIDYASLTKVVLPCYPGAQVQLAYIAKPYSNSTV